MSDPMDKIWSLNRKLICKPFETTNIETKQIEKFALIQQKINFLSSQVLYDFYLESHNTIVIHKGDFILVDGEAIKANWALKIYEFNEQKCILVPYESILIVRRI